MPPAIGSIRLKRLLFPWGRLYFALDANLSANPFRQGDYALLNYIRDNKEPIPEDRDSGKPDRAKDRAITLRLIAAVVAGAILSSLARLLFSDIAPQPRLPHPARLPQPFLIETVNRMVDFLAMFQVQFVFFAVFAFLAFYKRRQPSASIFAFVAGFSLPYILFHFMTLR
jgi:hypothetical protein